MAYVAPFRALRYDPSRVDISKAITQPYDKITPEMQDRYYAATPYNVVRIILGKRSPEVPNNNVYTRAAGFFSDWRHQGIVRPDAEPSIYSYSQRFTIPGGTAEFERRGFIALGRIEDYSAGIVFRHEQTLSKPKADRLELLRATQAHFGQIFMLYNDSGEVESLLARNTAPDIEVTDEFGVLHQVWKVSEPAVIEAVREQMRDKKLIIADGHHRYETALAYRNERRLVAQGAVASGGGTRQRSSGTAVLGDESSDAPYDWVMMTLVNMNSPGLIILPTHRVVHSLTLFSTDSFMKSARNYFNVEEVDTTVDAARATGLLQQAARAGTALLAVTPDQDLLLHTPPGNGRLFQGLSLRQQSLDVVQLHRVLLQKVLGLSEDSIRNQENLAYVRNTGEAIQRVRGGGANIAFLMNPVRIGQVRDIAFAGEVLPQKSTDFYPKMLTGLTVYALE
ncbi:MAG TPA: DUF1015 domain-containing protein [Terriglobales bacterium]|nr:DUF1015 domain-containing protein [Terriglobales bacterium]